jgi:hypothetical protein
MFLRWGRRTPPEHIGKRAFVLYGLDRNRIHPLSLSRFHMHFLDL